MNLDPDDNTAVLSMKRDFQHYLTRSTHPQGFKRKFGESFLDSSRDDERATKSSVSMKDIIDSQKEDQAREIELVSAKARITKLESELSHAELLRQNFKIDYERQLYDLKQVNQRSKDKIMELSKQIGHVTAREADSKRHLAEYKQNIESCKSSNDQTVLALRKEKYQLQTQLGDMRERSRSSLTELKNDHLRQKTELQICRDELMETKEHFNNAQRQLNELGDQLQEYEQLKLKAISDTHHIKGLEEKLSRIDEDHIHSQAMRSQLSQLTHLQTENVRLKDDIAYCKETEENALLLKEQVKSLTRKAEKVEQLSTQLAHAQVHNEELKKKVTELSAVSGTVPMSPLDLRGHVAELQNTSAILLQQQAAHKANSSSYQKQCTGLENQLSQVQLQHNTAVQLKQQLEAQVKRIQRKLLLVSKERDSYKHVIDSYESEVTVDISSLTAQRLHQLESVNTGYHKQMADLENELTRTTAQLNETRRHSQQSVRGGDKPMVAMHSGVDEQMLVSLREKVASLEGAVQKLKELNEVLEMRLERHNIQGDYDPTKTKVLHFGMNPVDMARKKRALQIETLTEENQRLKERLRMLEEGGKLEDLTVQVEQNLQEPSSTKELDDVKQQLTSSELKNKRLVEAFKKTSQEFREVCYQLLGYRIDIPCQNQYKLMSMYAETPEDYLLFQQSGDGEMQVLETDYSASVEDKMAVYLHGANSIPAFLSSVTLDVFNKQTILSDTR